MFVRIKTSTNSPKKSVQIVESFRDGKKVRQRIVRHVGTAYNEDELKSMRDLAEHIKVQLEGRNQASLFEGSSFAEMAITARDNQDDNPLPVDLKKLREESRIVTGIHEVFGKVYKLFGYDKVISNPKRKKAAVKHLCQAVMGRIAHPVSKRATAAMLTEHYGVGISTSALYRMMDQLTDPVIGKIQDLTYETVKSLFDEPLRVMFYDCTTLYFESFIEDELKENGYSKDMKFNQPQVLLSLLVTSRGLPVGYDVFPGATFEGHTLCDAMDKLEKRFGLDELILVADSAMFSEENLQLIEERGKKYIVGARIKNQSKSVTEKILQKDAYQPLSDGKSVREISINKRRLIVSNSLKRAQKDRLDRQRAIDKLMEKLTRTKNPKDLVSNFGYKKYIKVEGEASYTIDENKIKNAQTWDGLLGIITNMEQKDISCAEALLHYHGLWQVEQCFRVSKTDLRIRPIYHWTPPRIKAHIAICFMALACMRYLYYLTKVHQLNFSEQSIRQSLINVQLSVLRHIENDDKYGLPSKKTIQAEKLYQMMGLKLTDVPFKIR